MQFFYCNRDEEGELIPVVFFPFYSKVMQEKIFILSKAERRTESVLKY